MDALFDAGLQNAVAAAVLAVIVYGITRVWRNPHAGRALWLLVLVKLITPPVVHLPGPSLLGSVGSVEAHGGDLNHHLTAGARPGFSSTSPLAAPGATAKANDDHAARNQRGDQRRAWAVSWGALKPVLIFVWLSGSVLWAGVIVVRIIRFHQSLRRALPASERLLGRAEPLAERIGLTRCPEVRLLTVPVVPMVWPVGKNPTIVLPMVLFHEMVGRQVDAILAHELAHVRRGDHWVRWFELMVLALYWWHPVAWWATRNAHLAEDECCDGLAVSMLHENGRAYAEALVHAADLLSQNSRPIPAIASGFGRGGSLKRRIEMVLRNSARREATWRARACLLLFATAVLPVAMSLAGDQAGTPKGPSVPDEESATGPTLEDDLAEVGRPLWLIEANGSGLRRLTRMTDYTCCGTPRWCADGTKIACDAWKGHKGEDYRDAHVLVISADGSSVEDLGDGAMPSWSPGGNRIAFCRYGSGVWVMYADGSEKRQLDRSGWCARWSPDGRKIAWVAYDDGCNLGLYDLVEGDLRLVLEGEHRRYVQINHSFTWSPDGKQLCFKGYPDSDKQEIVIVDAEGSSKGFKVRLAQKTGWNLSWRPDGRRIMLGLRNPSTESMQLYTLDPDTDDRPELFPGQPATRINAESAWSPDGKTIVFPSERKK